jgi:N-acetyltransferase
MEMFEQAFVLESEKVRLRAIRANDIDAFRKIMFDTQTWEFFTQKYEFESDLTNFIENALSDFNSNIRCPLAIIDRATNSIVGSTSFGNISKADRRLEIGWTWLCQWKRGSITNVHTKYLQLKYAFENLNFERVEFKTDVLNVRARKSLLKIGAVEEGILRSHTQMHSGRRRDTIYYSVLSSEWSRVRDCCLNLMQPSAITKS